MANSSVVGTLRALLVADTADFVSATKKAGDAADKMAADIGKAGESIARLEPRMASVSRLVKDFGGSLERRSAEEFAMAIDKIGGAARLSETELRRASGVFGDYISKARAMGQEVPAHIQKVSDEIGRLSSQSGKSAGIIGEIKGAFQNLGPSVLAAAGGFVTAFVSVEALTRALQAGIQFVKSSIEEYAEAEKATRKLTAAMVAQKTATPEAISAMRGLANEFQRTTVFSDELIMEMQTLLIQVGNVMPGQMKEALNAATNLASGLGIDLRQATMLVAKGFEDNFTALKRYGIEIDVAKAKAEGMDYVLGRINERFGGQAAADLKTFSGQLQATQNQFSELQEVIGEAIVQSTAFQLAFALIRAEISKVSKEIEFFLTAGRALASMPGPVGQAFSMLLGDLKSTASGIDEVNSRIAEFRRQFVGGANLPSSYENLAAAVEKAKAKVKELTPEQLKQIEAAKTLGRGMEDLAKLYNLNADELKILTSGTKKNKKVVDEAAKAYEKWKETVTGAGLLKDVKELEKNLERLTKEGKLNAFAIHAIANAADDLAKKGAPLPATLRTLVNEVIGFNKGVVTSTLVVPQLSDALGVSGDEMRLLAKDYQDINKKIEDFNKLFGQMKLPKGLTGEEIKAAQAAILTFGEEAAQALERVGSEFLSLGHAIGGQAGEIIATVGAIAQGIGRLASGDVIGGITALTAAMAKFWKGMTRNIARDMQDAFATTELGFANLNTLMARLRELGAIDLVNAGDRAQRKDDEAATRKWMEDVRKFLAEVDAKAASLFGELADAVQQFGGKAPAQLQPLIQQLLQINALTDEQRKMLQGLAGDPAWQDLQQIAEKYGIELSALGQKFQDAKISDTAMQYARDFHTLKEAGADVSGVLTGMQDEVQQLVLDARKFGTALPEAMRGPIQGLIDMGLLLDENGNAFGSLEDAGVSFTGTFEDIFQDVKSILEEIRDLLAGGLPRAADQGAKGIEDAFKRMPRVKVGVDVDWGQFSPPEGFRTEVPGMAAGGIVTRPTLAMVGEAGPEAVLPLGDLSGMFQIDNRIFFDGREMTGVVVQHLREVVRRKGTRPI